MTQYISLNEATKNPITVQTREYGSIEVVPIDFLASLPSAIVLCLQCCMHGNCIVERVFNAVCLDEWRRFCGIGMRKTNSLQRGGGPNEHAGVVHDHHDDGRA